MVSWTIAALSAIPFQMTRTWMDSFDRFMERLPLLQSNRKKLNSVRSKKKPFILAHKIICMTRKYYKLMWQIAVLIGADISRHLPSLSCQNKSIFKKKPNSIKVSVVLKISLNITGWLCDTVISLDNPVTSLDDTDTSLDDTVASLDNSVTSLDDSVTSLDDYVFYVTLLGTLWHHWTTL